MLDPCQQPIRCRASDGEILKVNEFLFDSCHKTVTVMQLQTKHLETKYHKEDTKDIPCLNSGHDRTRLVVLINFVCIIFKLGTSVYISITNHLQIYIHVH